MPEGSLQQPDLISQLVAVSVTGTGVQRLCMGLETTKDAVVTAGHCLIDARNDDVKIYWLQGKVIREANVQHSYFSPNLDIYSGSADIALLRTSGGPPIANSAHLAGNSDLATPQSATTFSWGGNLPSLTHPIEPKETPVITASPSACTAQMGSALGPGNSCAELEHLGQSCAGDSGGPVIKMLSPTSYILFGVVSHVPAATLHPSSSCSGGPIAFSPISALPFGITAVASTTSPLLSGIFIGPAVGVIGLVLALVSIRWRRRNRLSHQEG